MHINFLLLLQQWMPFISLLPYLLEESNELTGAPLVRLGQVEILQVENQPLTVLGPVHTAIGGAHHHTHLWGVHSMVFTLV